jgi:hypothetical protein
MASVTGCGRTKKPGKGVTLTGEEIKKLRDILSGLEL